MERKVKFSYDFKLCCVQEVLRDNCSLGFVARQEGYNAIIENFFGVLKSDMFYTQKFKSVDDLKLEINKYIGHYNKERIKSN